MKTKYLLLGAIFSVFALTSRAQVTEMYYQGFESGEAATYTATPTSCVRNSSVIYSGGNRAIKLVQHSSQETELILDTLDFTQNTTLRYIALRFDHICRVPKNGNSDFNMGMIYYKRANQTDWTALSSQEYNVSGEFSADFNGSGSFKENSYPEWWSSSVPTVSNEQWHSERFDLDNVMTSGVPVNERKLLIKFVLRHRTLTSALDTNNVAWWLDNIKVSASAERMVSPRITMRDYPYVEQIPNSRGAHIELSATTNLSTGINPDSVYLYYTVGSDLATQHKLFLTPVTGVANVYECRIPFFGYDTLMRFYCVVRDATGNANTVTFPPTDDTWIEYRSVRGPTEQPGVQTPQFTGTTNNAANWFPFPVNTDHKCEFVYDSALMADAGYGPGAITSLRFTLGTNINTPRNQPRFQIKMKNIPTDYTVDEVDYNYQFTYDFMRVVYDSALTLPVLTAGLTFDINLQDTFFYSGQNVLMQITTDGSVDHDSYANVKLISTPSTLKSFYTYDLEDYYGYNAFAASPNEVFKLADPSQSIAMRPAIVFSEFPLQPLLYDAGISELVDPNYTVPMTVRPGSLTVKLKNYGSNVLNAVRISYNIDDTLTGYFDWTGTLTTNQTANVIIANNINIPAGFHTLKVWVEDTVTSSSMQYRDHEPYNDTCFSQFVVCDGPLNGVRNIGGSMADFNDIEELLFSLSRCGIDDSLVVRLAPGEYPAFTMPAVSGITDQHYIVFESMGSNRAVIYFDSTMSQSSVVNLAAVNNIRFRNIDFSRRDGYVSDMVTLGPNSVNCRFEGCAFLDSMPNVPASMRINAMINTGYASNLTIDSCTFVGGILGVDVKGQAPDDHSSSIVVRKSLFREQYTSAVKVEYVDNITIDDNEMYDVLSNAGSVLQLNDCDGIVHVESNRVYTSHGAGGIAVNDASGTADNHVIIANNMIVCNDDASANLLRSPFNIIQASYADVVYNSVKMVAPTRNGVAAATFGGGGIENCRFVNNIVVSLSEMNYALGYQPLTSTSNEVSHNVYYSNGIVLNRRGTTSYGTLEAWVAAMPNDTTSVSVNPNFLNGSLVDLRTYNRAIRGVGMPIAGVTTDIYDTVRGDSVTCPGAFEFISLPYDFEVEALINPLDDNCNMPAQTELVVRLRNSGVNAYDSTSTSMLTLSCKVNNGAVSNININPPIPADTIVEINTGHLLSLPPSGTLDATYNLRVWVSYAGDPNKTNDTNVFTVISRYHPAAPADDSLWISYASSATITPTVGVNTWSVYGNTSAPHPHSQLYWYEDSTDAEPFFVGPSYTTPALQESEVYYVRQRRSLPIVRITQVEISHNAAADGVSNPMPYWMLENRKAAVQLTNIGDAPAHMEGDTLLVVSPVSSLNNKVYVFPNVTIDPGKSLVLQYVANGVSDSNFTLRTGLTPSVAWNSNIAFVYKHDGAVVDAIPFNGVITTTSTQAVSWANLSVPNYVWSGTALSFENNVAGIIRTGFSGNVGDWDFSTSAVPMSLGKVNDSWIMYRDNGCEGDMATFTVNLLAPPPADLEVSEIYLPEDGCFLTDSEDVTVLLRNYGFDTVNNVVLHYYAGNDTITETMVGDIVPHGDTTYTFTNKLNMIYPNDTSIVVRVWVDSVEGDPVILNDTNQIEVLARYTPAQPDSIADRLVQYATSDTITNIPVDNVIPVWYDYNLDAVDTGYTHITELLYGNGTRGMAYMAMNATSGQVGTAVTTNSNTAFPSPYQASSRYIKQQYIYSASEMAAAGVTPGSLTALSFYLDTLVGSTDSIVYNNYTIALGLTTDTIFQNTTAWKDAPIVVFQRDAFVIHQNDDHAWVTHNINPFVWDGTSSVVVQLSYELTTAVTTGVRTAYTSKANTTLHKNSNTALAPSTAGFVGTGTKGGNRPNIKFSSTEYGCIGPMMTYNVNLYGMPDHDAAIFWATSFDTVPYNSCDSISLSVKMRNQGSMAFDTVNLYYSIDNMAMDTVTYIDSFAAGQMYDLMLFNRRLSPGRHSLTAVVDVNGDTISSNDTINCVITVRFCSGVYSIGTESTADYHSFGAAVDTLNLVGILGPVMFEVSEGTYTEQVVLNSVNGSSPINTISFIGQTDSVYLTASTSQTANYVMFLDGASNIRLQNIKMVARPTANGVNYANVLVMQNDSNITIQDSYFKVKGTIVNANASCIVLQGNVSNLTMTGSVTDSGYYAVKSAGAVNNYSNIHFTNNVFRDFASGGINIRGVNVINLTQNELRSGNSADNRGLIGVYLAETTDSMIIQKNKIYLVDERKGAKRGIQLEGVMGTTLNPGFIVNNMISTYGTDSKGLTPAKSAGIWIDSASSYIKVFYNSIRVRGSNVMTSGSNDLSYGFWCGNTPSEIMVMNNIISNFGYGYAYYVSELNTVTTSNYNAYYSNNEKKFAWKLTNFTTLADLQQQNNDDANSLLEEPYFSANDDLHLTMTNFATKAQYNTDVIDDIDGNNRPQIPAPTIGAHEKDRLIHDMAVVRIIKPEMPINISIPNNIETDSVLVVASFNNNGLSNENNIQWYAYIEGHESETRSVNRNLGSFSPSQMKTDSVMIPTVLGITDTQYIHVVVIAANDTSLADNEMSSMFYLAPAFNLAAVRMEATCPELPAGCRMYNTQIRIYVKNDGSKPFPAGTTIKIGYHTELSSSTYPDIPTLPDTVEQNVTLDNILPIGSTVFFDFAQTANLYPTNTYTDIKVRVRGWCNYIYDITQSNDTTGMQASQSPIKDSYFSPAPPLGHDTVLAYGTWGEVTAEQENNRPIRWFRDSTASPFYSPSQYNASTKWSNTPQYFHDSVYYLNCLSTKNCPSEFSQVTVSVAARKSRDMAMEAILAPLGGRVYMENDTVRVRIANYGTQPQSNIPVTYELKRGTTIIQTVTDIVSQTVAPGDTLIFTFDTLLAIPTPTTSQNYSLNVWTDLNNDATRRNDTIRTPCVFSSLPQDRYNTFSGNYPSSEITRFDITRVSFNGIDFELPVLNRAYTNLADYSSPDYPVLHVNRGTSDSIIIQVTPLNPEEQRFRCRATIAIDYNRDGLFTSSGSCSEIISNGSVFYNDSLFTTVITIPECASYGYMRMRVKVMGYADEATDGHIIDFLLFVDEDVPVQDVAITQIVTPRDRFVRDDQPRVVKFRIANRGQSALNSLDINYSFVCDTIVDSLSMGVVNWTGSLAPGASTVVSLPAHVFPYGTSSLTIWHELDGDVNPANNTLLYEYHRFHVLAPVVVDSFDFENYWYAPKGYNTYSQNFWQRGMPNKARLDTTYSGDNAWVTDLNNSIVTGRRGSVSYLYSPIINQAFIRCDTVSFRLRRNLTGGSTMHVEYLNYDNKWVKLENVNYDTWYNDVENQVFSGTSSNSEGYALYAFSTNFMSGDFQELVQFRLVYSTPMGSTAASSYGEGCAVDNFYLGRARRPVDAGVVDITKPEAPQYGQTVYPEVVVRNYGTDTLRSIRVGYTHYGSYMPKENEFVCHIAPGGYDTFLFTTPFVITSNYPDSFYITAFTMRTDDVYDDNDTVSKMFYLLPLERDISAEALVAPLSHVVAGDTAVKVTLRIQNGGFAPITHATASYVVNGVNRYDEELDFEELLGRPLQSLEYYNYTFHRKIRANMGVMNLTAFIKSPVNDYIYNDTVNKRVEGIMSITDISTKTVIIDTSGHNGVSVGLVIENLGARGVNNFQVGYYIDNDTTTMVRETYYRSEPLAALNTGYYRFNQILPDRTAPYNVVTGFVNVVNDNDPSNDTSNVIAPQYVDLEVLKVLVEENANPNCRVFLELRNIGNMAIDDKVLSMHVVINGGDSIELNKKVRVDPWNIIHVEMNTRVPKSPVRQYVGTGWINSAPGDNNGTNDQTSIVEVINYFEGVPSVNGNNFVLEQNYPNPFSHQTTIPFTLPAAAKVRFFVMDAMGHIVHNAVRFCQAGDNSITIDMEDYSAGIYYYGIEVDGQRQMRKMILR